MIDWIKHWDLIQEWQWDRWHIGCSLFIILVIFTVRWIYLDSIKKNKNERDKKAGAKTNIKTTVNGKR
jgi:hypothetical protein